MGNEFFAELSRRLNMFLYPHIEYLRELIHSGRLVELAEEAVGDLA